MISAQIRRVIAAGMVGNVLEWYDFAIYGYFAAAIGRHFFPHEDPVAQLLSAFGVFAVGYLMRPIGGVLIGHIGDRFGRRAALTFSVAAMAVPTFLIGLLPGYAAIALLAPVALILLRIVQVLSVGGEYTSSMVFLVEHAPEGRRGLMGALAACGATGGILLGSAVGAGFAASMSAETLRRLGLAHPVPARAGGRACRLHSASVRAGNRVAGETQARSDRRDAFRSLAAGRWLHRLVGIQCSDLLRRFHLPGELAANRRRHSALTRARDQLIQHGNLAGSRDRGRLLDRSLRTQAPSPVREHSRPRRCASAVLALESFLRVACAARAARLCTDDGALWRNAARHFGGSSAAAGPLHGGGIGL